MYDQVKNYYGKVLEDSNSLKTNACCTDTGMPRYLKDALSNIHDEVISKYYGCGLILPELLEGTRVLDLGSGSGRDCYVLAQLVGAEGEIVGVDMTDEQLAVARRHQEFHRKRFGYDRTNVTFKQGYIEHLDELGLASNSFDLIVSNCVINLSQDKEAVLREAYRLLKPGGEFYFSDVYADKRVPEALIQDPVLFGECLSGALYWQDFVRLARKAGFNDPRVLEEHAITIDNEDVEKKIGHINFSSVTCRLFKIPELEHNHEDYQQKVTYLGDLPHHEQVFSLDKHHNFKKGEAQSVCGNTYRMLNQTRFNEYFHFVGSRQTHYGSFSTKVTDLHMTTDQQKNCC